MFTSGCHKPLSVNEFLRPAMMNWLIHSECGDPGVGIDYPIAGDDYSGRGRTRYTDRFHSFVQAESQLLKRSEEFM